MKSWFNKLLSRSAEVSSKRVAGIWSLLVCIALVFIDTFTPFEVQYYMFRDLLLFSGGCFGLVLAENLKKESSNQNEQTPENEAN